MFSELSKQELEVILDISYKCLAVKSRGDVVPVFDRLNELIMFRAAAIAIQEKKQGHKITLDWINHSFSLEWTEFYRENHYGEVDPLLLRAKKAEFPYTWEEARSYAGEGDKKTMDFLCDLSDREVETLKWATEGKSSWEIGQIMGISERTIKFHFSNIFNKLNVVNRAQAVAIGVSCGVI